MVFEDTYAEFKLQAQNYNQEKRFNSFSEILRNVAGAEKLHFLVSAAAIGYLQQLNGIIPDITNNLGKLFLKFSNYHFEIVNSDLSDISKHQIALSFFSDEITWIDTISDYLLIAEAPENVQKEIQTHLLLLRPFLSIYSLR
jgi:hypothetical protein